MRPRGCLNRRCDVAFRANSSKGRKPCKFPNSCPRHVSSNPPPSRARRIFRHECMCRDDPRACRDAWHAVSSSRFRACATCTKLSNWQLAGRGNANALASHAERSRHARICNGSHARLAQIARLRCCRIIARFAIACCVSSPRDEQDLRAPKASSVRVIRARRRIGRARVRETRAFERREEIAVILQTSNNPPV